VLLLGKCIKFYTLGRSIDLTVTKQLTTLLGRATHHIFVYSEKAG